jgi:isopentenyldiphosphate isomerase
VVKVHTSNFDLLDGELDNGEFVSIQQLENMIASDQYDLETWSEIAFPALKNMLK